ncbi:hypothetical protein EHS86_13185 [Erwinia amylovora]|uniref:Inner membrane protein yhjX n=3 Tax=Erwinia amylovora TaxID=552 RepID=A0A831ET51_ERWAM|nr:hypothetical protein AD997_12075 [Erwinia amylovora]EKV53474.1 Inner membrane protein yhjX [Erwinia amylovora ACW56400]CBA21770.1 Inner membrane protein yhjX [Erwinia amylovora CFBP1430]CBX81345.1 Inner membrane protein yhjX [Erwinia amylovora ATCC BAA-2158]CCO79324.1 Inner membrane protein yhjX [Erwinia amylovora Ea356]CCO83130.1 Inner membrane protein yhjX [Erwinia amylovora Ea266]CCO86891.1 Inner membrane protein yhjX [Erwinia amylovora CFBP 2585]CCO90687.1 Inner membrane protein yhjX 
MRLPQYWLLALMFRAACISSLFVTGVAKDTGENGCSSTQIAANAATSLRLPISVAACLGILSDKIARIRNITLA